MAAGSNRPRFVYCEALRQSVRAWMWQQHRGEGVTLDSRPLSIDPNPFCCAYDHMRSHHPLTRYL